MPLETSCIHSQMVPEDVRRGPLFVGGLLRGFYFNLLDDQSQLISVHQRESASEGAQIVGLLHQSLASARGNFA